MWNRTSALVVAVVAGLTACSASFGGSGPDLSECPKGEILFNEAAVAPSQCFVGHYEGKIVQSIDEDVDPELIGRPCSVDFNGMGKDGLFVVDGRRIVLWFEPGTEPDLGYTRSSDMGAFAAPPTLRFSSYHTDHRFSPYGPGTWMGANLHIGGDKVEGMDIDSSGHRGDIAIKIEANDQDDLETFKTYYCGMTIKF